MRAILTFILFLLLGLATSLAVAWGATLRYVALGDETLIDRDGWRVRITAGPTATLIEAYRPDGQNARRTASGDAEHAELPRFSVLRQHPAGAMRVQEFAAGWPLRCLRFSHISDSADPLCALEYASTGAMEGANPLGRFGGDWPTSRYLPAAPIYGNLLVNALIWGAAWLILMRLFHPLRYLRAINRTRREICPACRYDMRLIGSARCPECGCLRNYRPPLLTDRLLGAGAVTLSLLLAIEVAFVLAFRSNPHYAPIHRAAWQGDAAAIEAELARGVGADLRMPRDSTPHLATPLWLAAARGHAGAASVLIDAGADLSWRAAALGSPLDIAARRGEADMLALLLEAGARVNDVSALRETALHHAAVGGDEATVRTLIERGARIDAADFVNATPLHGAAAAGRAGAIRVLLDAGADVNAADARGERPLMYAVRAGEEAAAAALLDAQANVHGFMMTEAVRAGRAEIVELLIAHGGDALMTNRRGETLLFQVDRQPRALALWELLTDQGVDVNADSRGRTILMYAAGRGSPEFFRFLLANGAAPDATDPRGRTVLDYAGEDRREMIQRLLDEHRGPDGGDA